MYQSSRFEPSVKSGDFPSNKISARSFDDTLKLCDVGFKLEFFFILAADTGSLTMMLH